jgi:hypothetical protein
MLEIEICGAGGFECVERHPSAVDQEVIGPGIDIEADVALIISNEWIRKCRATDCGSEQSGRCKS